MKTSIAAALAGLAMASTPTLGADLFGTAPPPLTFPANQSPFTEVGSNWYLRGDVGYERRQAPTRLDGGGLHPDRLAGNSALLQHAGHVELARRRLRRHRPRLPLQQLSALRRRLRVPDGRTGAAPRPLNVASSARRRPRRDRRHLRRQPATSRQRNSTALASAYLDLGNTGASRLTSAPAPASTPTRFREFELRQQRDGTPSRQHSPAAPPIRVAVGGAAGATLQPRWTSHSELEPSFNSTATRWRGR